MIPTHQDFDDEDLAYCEGDAPFEETDWDEVTRLQGMIDAIAEHPTEEHRNLAAVGVLAEMYGDDLDVR